MSLTNRLWPLPIHFGTRPQEVICHEYKIPIPFDKQEDSL
jgi:hypothetical protein